MAQPMQHFLSEGQPGETEQVVNSSLAAVAHMLFFTDLDRCLADSPTDPIENARPALDALRSSGIPLVLITGRTRAEIEPIRQRLDHRDPFIVEEGAAVFVPLGTFAFSLDRSRLRSSYQVIELGTPYAMLRDVLRQIEEAVKSPLRGFGDLSLEDIMSATGLSHDEALRAKTREYGEPFLMQGPSTLLDEVYRQIAGRDLQCTKGERFFHLTGANSTARGADILLDSYRRKWKDQGLRHVLTPVVIGEDKDDLPMLLNADHPIVLKGRDGCYDADAPGLMRPHGMGPARWNEAVLNLLKHAV
jgi:mannosyl-3-phosphoglycerate phosphatase